MNASTAALIAVVGAEEVAPGFHAHPCRLPPDETPGATIRGCAASKPLRTDAGLMSPTLRLRLEDQEELVRQEAVLGATGRNPASPISAFDAIRRDACASGRAHRALARKSITARRAPGFEHRHQMAEVGKARLDVVIHVHQQGKIDRFRESGRSTGVALHCHQVGEPRLARAPFSQATMSGSVSTAYLACGTMCAGERRNNRCRHRCRPPRMPARAPAPGSPRAVFCQASRFGSSEGFWPCSGTLEVVVVGGVGCARDVSGATSARAASAARGWTGDADLHGSQRSSLSMPMVLSTYFRRWVRRAVLHLAEEVLLEGDLGRWTHLPFLNQLTLRGGICGRRRSGTGVAHVGRRQMAFQLPLAVAGCPASSAAMFLTMAVTMVSIM